MKISLGLSKGHWPLWLKRAKAKKVITGKKFFFAFLAIFGQHSKSFFKKKNFGLQRPKRLAFSYTTNLDWSYEQIKINHSTLLKILHNNWITSPGMVMTLTIQKLTKMVWKYWQNPGKPEWKPQEGLWGPSSIIWKVTNLRYLWLQFNYQHVQKYCK